MDDERHVGREQHQQGEIEQHMVPPEAQTEHALRRERGAQHATEASAALIEAVFTLAQRQQAEVREAAQQKGQHTQHDKAVKSCELAMKVP